ncbi:hypothetical protein IJ556_05040 [bacterium]|nr:hypothetical protein [bacterium]
MYYALTDNDTFIKAEDVTANEQNNNFYCPCRICRCRFGFRNINSNKRRNSFFKLPSSSHVEACFVPYIKSEEGGLKEYETSSLSLEGLLKEMESLSHGTNKTHVDVDKSLKPVDKHTGDLKQISTIRQLYNICAANSPDTELKKGVKIKDVFDGKNTAFLYTNYISGIKLVECQFENRYDLNTQTLYFKYPHNGDALMLPVSFVEKDLFFKTKNQLWNFKHPVVIYAKWTNSGCQIKSRRQLIPLKPNI